MAKTTDDRVEILKEVLIKFINYSELSFTEREYLKTKLQEEWNG